MSSPRDFVDFAHRLADAARPIIAKYFRTSAGLSDKPDSTPVTLADQEAEAAMRALIEAEQPEHGILGEEEGGVREDAEWLWVLDPIDGTKAFATGKHSFGTLIGLARDGVPVLGVIDQPVLKERWIGGEGVPTTLNGMPARVRDCPSASEAWMYATSPYMFRGNEKTAFERLAETVKHPLFGTDCYGYALLTSCFVDLVCEARLKPWDFCAVAPVIQGAGGVMTDWSGTRLTLGSDGRVLAAGDARCHADALELLAGRKPL